MRPDFLTARRDAPFAAINMIARAAALVAQNPMGALQTARAERPDDYELHRNQSRPAPPWSRHPPRRLRNSRRPLFPMSPPLSAL